jgi:hypothetical protein
MENIDNNGWVTITPDTAGGEFTQDGWKTVAEGNDLDTGNTPQAEDTVGLGDVLLDTFHMAGATGDAVNDDGTPDTSGDFFGGSNANERVWEGVKEASGYNSGNMLTEVGKGLEDLLNAGMAGMDTTVADLINMVDSDNSVADHYRKLGEDRLKAANYPDGAATAVGEELGSMAVEAPVGGKVADALLGTGKLVGKGYRAAANNRKAAREAQEVDVYDKNQAFNKGSTTVMKDELPKSPAESLLKGLAPDIVELIKKYKNRLLAPVSKRAAQKEAVEFVESLKAKGVSPERANAIYGEVSGSANLKGAGKTVSDAIFKSPSKKGGVAGILAGQNREDNK